MTVNYEIHLQLNSTLHHAILPEMGNYPSQGRAWARSRICGRKADSFRTGLRQSLAVQTELGQATGSLATDQKGHLTPPSKGGLF
jgi:hypothetical protein